MPLFISIKIPVELANECLTGGPDPFLQDNLLEQNRQSATPVQGNSSSTCAASEPRVAGPGRMSRLCHNALPEVAPADASPDRHVNIEQVETATVPRPTPRVIEKLRALGLHYNEPERAVLCSRCGFALKADADRVSRNLGEKHRVLS